MSMMKRLMIFALVIIAIMLWPVHTNAQTTKPFSLPFRTPPGPGTWLIEQQYGDTNGAYNFGKYWYAAGQGLHFGIDFVTPCATPLVAIADGVVDEVDNPAHGALPHNLMIAFPDLGYKALYGHLYVKPSVKVGQQVKRGDVVAQSGDPDESCVSRPHLHLEIRSMDTLTAYDPAKLIDADWPMLSSIGYADFAGFTKDLYAPNRWQSIDQQPDVKFGSVILNDYRATWPPTARLEPPPQTYAAYDAPPIAENEPLKFQQITPPGCCSQPWWSPDSQSVDYWDGPDGQFANVMSVGVDTANPTPQPVSNAPSRLLSSDGQYEVQWDNGTVSVIRESDKTASLIATNGAWPQFSPNHTHLLWRYMASDDLPGTTPPTAQIWISNLDGSGRKLIRSQQGGSAYWLDDDRVLLMTREGRTTLSALSIYTISTGEINPLLTESNLYRLSISPGGKYIMYYLVFQQDSAMNGLHLMETQPNAAKTALPFFGSWRWRDSHSIIYIPYEPGQPMRFILYDVVTGQSRALTDPTIQQFSIANDDWSISPDGKHLVFWENKDYSLWLVTLP